MTKSVFTDIHVTKIGRKGLKRLTFLCNIPFKIKIFLYTGLQNCFALCDLSIELEDNRVLLNSEPDFEPKADNSINELLRNI